MIFYHLVFIDFGKKFNYLDASSKGDKLIDVASGTGDLAGYFSKKCNHNCKVYCVEPNKGMFEIGKRKLKKIF